jgi:small-conductance mechanosensitive channel
MDYDIHTDKGKLLSVFLYIKGCINSVTNIAYPQIETIKKHTNINSDATIIKYIKILQDIGLILYDNVGLRMFADNSVKYAENAYVMNYEGYDRILEDYLVKKQEELNEKQVKVKNKKDTNLKRSETMKRIWAERKANNN